MARKRKHRSSMGESSNNIETGNLETGRTNVERGDRTMSGGAHGDRTAGNEGIDTSFSGQGDQKEGSEHAEGTGYTSNTDKSESEK